uniref:DNA-directed RNA polymerase subunit 5 n=1 Tax=Pithovirus LCPAC302 TaxID=2506593 RepID=A0A481Z8I5_9VIRU|nr:MAG: DNA-directed RNA polymerase subunit 5 [Pithovirus LCPAC302]
MTDIDPEISARLFEIKKNQLKMVESRGYNIDRERGILELGLDQFLSTYVPFAKQKKKSFRSVMTNVYEKADGQRILVYFADVPSASTQLGVNEIGDAIVDMNTYKLHNAVIITPKDLSPSAKKHIDGLVAYNIQLFLEEEMSYDPTEHFLVPKHIPLTVEEQRDFLTKNNISFDQLPIILTSDIIARYYGLRGGQVVRIERENMYQTMILKSVSYKAIKEA